MNELKDLKNEWKKVQLEIRPHIGKDFSVFYFLRHVISFLRMNTELSSREDYRRLYDETMTLLILQSHAHNGWTREEPKDQQGWQEFLIDLEARAGNHTNIFSYQTVEQYLKYRKTMWEKGIRYTKETYGFI